MFIFASRHTVNAALRSYPLPHMCSLCLLYSIPSFSYLACLFFSHPSFMLSPHWQCVANTSTSTLSHALKPRSFTSSAGAYLAPCGRFNSRSSCFGVHVLFVSNLQEKNFKGIFSSQRMILPSNHRLHTHSSFSHRNEKQPNHTCAGLMWQTVVAPLRIQNVSLGFLFLLFSVVQSKL